MMWRLVIAFAALSGPLPKAGVIVVALLAALVLLTPDRRACAVSMPAALVVASVLLLADIWDSPRLGVVHRHPLEAVVGAVLAVGVLIAAAAVLARRPRLVAPLAVLALPFRVPIKAGGTTSNLLVPLYLVVAVGALASAFAAWRAPRPDAPEPGQRPRWVPPAGATDLVGWAERLLALYVVLYAVQATYSPDFVKALQNMVFFYVPFALLYRLLRDLPWTSRALRTCLRVTVVLAVIFSIVGFYEYATKTILLNPKLVVQNDQHTYFTVNSFFFDPDIFGRYLAVGMILLAVGLIYNRPRREQSTVSVVLAILWACLVLTLSRSSLGALLVGMAVLAALRWKPSRALVVAVAVVAIGAVAIVASPRTFGLNQGLNGASSGRGGLVSGGLSLFADRPVWGFGSGSFSTEYVRHHRHTVSALSDSHTIPITIAAEQGLIGEIAYLALVLVAIAALVRGARGDPVRSAVAAAFVALMFHTLLYADFLEDPTTWVLLAIGLALARAPGGVPALSDEEPAVSPVMARAVARS
ncbi:MAG TPA: O-antigen ligase family protein [Solirubrobacteraceae bacterium]|jgi:O-antigen ligase|nr:O-antigen ligase family protein [Solirubrobacteraceae bacterium]